MNTLIHTLSAAHVLVHSKLITPTFACVQLRLSDDPCYACALPTGACKLWLGRAHVDQWVDHVRDNDLVDPPEALLAESTQCMLFSSEAELTQFLVWAGTIGHVPY